MATSLDVLRICEGFLQHVFNVSQSNSPTFPEVFVCTGMCDFALLGAKALDFGAKYIDLGKLQGDGGGMLQNFRARR